MITVCILPPGASIERTDAVAAKIEAYVQSMPEVADVITLGGMDQLAGGSSSTSSGCLFVVLKPWEERKGPGRTPSRSCVG
jgi:multidrug efflux pump subunit AcrB